MGYDVVKFNLYNSYFKVHYINEVLVDSLGYAGTEIIRRVVGDSKVLEVTNVENLEQRISLERVLIKNINKTQGSFYSCLKI